MIRVEDVSQRMMTAREQTCRITCMGRTGSKCKYHVEYPCVETTIRSSLRIIYIGFEVNRVGVTRQSMHDDCVYACIGYRTSYLID